MLDICWPSDVMSCHGDAFEELICIYFWQLWGPAQLLIGLFWASGKTNLELKNAGITWDRGPGAPGVARCS